MAWYSKFAQKWLFLVVCIVNSKPKSLVFNSPSPTWAKNLNPDRAQSPFQLVLSRFVSQTGRIRDFFRWPSSFGQKRSFQQFSFYSSLSFLLLLFNSSRNLSFFKSLEFFCQWTLLRRRDLRRSNWFKRPINKPRSFGLTYGVFEVI